VSRNTYLNDMQRAELAQRYRAGETAKALATAFGVDYSTALRVLTDQGIPVRQMGRRENARRNVEILRKHADGIPVATLSKEYGISRQTIYKMIERRARPKPAASKESPPPIPLVDPEALELAQALLEWLDNIDEDAPLDHAELLARRIVMKAKGES
jgi:transposase